jgi:hypothetical protein
MSDEAWFHQSITEDKYSLSEGVTGFAVFLPHKHAWKATSIAALVFHYCIGADHASIVSAMLQAVC